MSSAILYVAIVAIWIGVLVPRWLKHENSQSGLRRLSRHFGAHAADEEPARVGFDSDGRPRYTSFVPPEPPAEVPSEGAPEAQTHAPVYHSESRSDYEEKVSSVAGGNNKSMTELYEAHAPRPAAPAQGEIPSYGWSADQVARQEHLNPASAGASSDAADASGALGAHGPAAPHDDLAQPEVRVPAPRGPHHDDLDDTERRAQIVRGRRRMLWLLLVLTAVGVGLAYLQLAAWWVMIPPTVLLVGYLLLLREAAHADAEARERRDLAHAKAPATPAAPARTAAEAGQAAEAASNGTEAEIPVEETGPRADIIDLSEHVGDQLYDQYADAKLRAVGD
ncbi:MAG TPA: hypothetical protein VIZ20_20415 [Streptosporangiaceae bacterium]